MRCRLEAPLAVRCTDGNHKLKTLRRTAVGSHLLDYDDVQTALTIVLEVLKVFSDVFSHPFYLITCEYLPSYKLLFKDSFDISEIVKLEYFQK